MNLFKNYIEYIKDNPKGYWFKRKLYGWGWVPAKWQGWFIILIFFIFVFCGALELGPTPSDHDTIFFLLEVFLSVVLLIYICYKKGEKPKWQWGDHKSR